MQLALYASCRSPHGASRLVYAMAALTRRAQFRHCGDARVYGLETTAVHEMSTPSPPVSLLEVGMVHRLERDVWSMVGCFKAGNKRVRPRPPPSQPPYMYNDGGQQTERIQTHNVLGGTTAWDFDIGVWKATNKEEKQKKRSFCRGNPTQSQRRRVLCYRSILDDTRMGRQHRLLRIWYFVLVMLQPRTTTITTTTSTTTTILVLFLFKSHLKILFL